MRFGGAYGQEDWSCGLRLQVSGAALDQGDTAVSEELADAIVPKLQTFWTGVRQYASLGTALDWLTVNHIGRDGRYTSLNSVRRDLERVSGSASGPWLGADVSMAVSLLTATERGYASKGRIFLPLNHATLVTTFGDTWGTWPLAMRTAVGGHVRTLIEEINDLGVETGLDVSVCIFSPGTGKRQDPTKPGEYRPVTKLRIGSLPDTQRRRQNRTPDLRGADVQDVMIAS
jgi:hypothetical protein